MREPLTSDEEPLGARLYIDDTEELLGGRFYRVDDTEEPLGALS